MTTIMKKKRERTREMILNAAHELISANGLEETAMESIAERAEIASGTLYNYYGSKSALMIALFGRMTKGLHDSLPERSAAPLNCENAITDLIAALHYFAQSVTMFSKPITRQIYAYMFVLDPADIAELTALDLQVMALIIPILDDMKQAGFLAVEIDVQAAAMLLYGSSMMQRQAYIMISEMTQDQLSDSIEMQVRTQFNGILLRPK